MPFADAFSGEITETMVYAAIADVLDPELDESLVKLGFIDHVRIDGGNVTVAFKLPTYWCAPNFAYLMAADLRAKVLAIPGVHTAHILLQDHCTDEEINASINTDKSFTEAFPDEAHDNLEELRQIFLRKGFLMRQDMLLRKLQKAGVGEETLLALRVADLAIDEATQCATITTPRQVIHLERTAQSAQAYLRRAALLGLHQGPRDLLFIDDHGQAIPPGGLQHYLRQSRSVRMNIMFNTIFCSDMFQTRYGSGEKKF
ncbi:MAG TPA: iron-sulfur cluster assembly protein [Ktedonosporobacter sp.]|jgi:metal-sulfur cluster biosynthetic enzyme|nr:iron-sulfur cluster assembly protein [Ktedonosporobacter sp.]